MRNGQGVQSDAFVAPYFALAVPPGQGVQPIWPAKRYDPCQHNGWVEEGDRVAVGVNVRLDDGVAVCVGLSDGVGEDVGVKVDVGVGVGVRDAEEEPEREPVAEAQLEALREGAALAEGGCERVELALSEGLQEGVNGSVKLVGRAVAEPTRGEGELLREPSAGLREALELPVEVALPVLLPPCKRRARKGTERAVCAERQSGERISKSRTRRRIAEPASGEDSAEGAGRGRAAEARNTGKQPGPALFRLSYPLQYTDFILQETHQGDYNFSSFFANTPYSPSFVLFFFFNP